jgi:hypothetical protein
MNERIVVFFICVILLSALTNTAKTQIETNDMETFFDSKISCIEVQVNATSRAKPNSSISVVINITSLVTEVHIKTVKLTIYGFVNGTERQEVYNNVSYNKLLSKYDNVVYLHPVFVPENISGIIYGELYLDYDATVVDELGRKNPYPFQGTIGFALTRIENVYLKALEEKLKSLEKQIEDINNVLGDLNQTFRECFGRNLTRAELLNLNQTLWELKQEYETLKGVKSELESTRTAVVFLAVVAVFFVATTAYLVLRRPKSYL